MLVITRVRALRYCHGHLQLFSLLSRSPSRSIQTQTQSYQDSKLDNIRNIGIIAHVDAVWFNSGLIFAKPNQCSTLLTALAR